MAPNKSAFSFYHQLTSTPLPAAALQSAVAELFPTNHSQLLIKASETFRMTSLYVPKKVGIHSGLQCCEMNRCTPDKKQSFNAHKFMSPIVLLRTQVWQIYLQKGRKTLGEELRLCACFVLFRQVTSRHKQKQPPAFDLFHAASSSMSCAASTTQLCFPSYGSVTTNTTHARSQFPASHATKKPSSSIAWIGSDICKMRNNDLLAASPKLALLYCLY